MAFGSIPHDKLFDMMNRLNLPTGFIDLSKNIYSNSSSRFHQQDSSVGGC